MSQEMENQTGSDIQEISANISTKAPKAVEKGVKPEGWEIELPSPFYGKTIEDLCEIYGADRVLSYAVAQFTVRFQSAVRTLACAGKSDEEIANTMANWKPGDKLSSGTSVESIIKNFGNMSPEEQAKLFDMLQKVRAEKG